jgi:hypothetical protein
MDPRSYKQESTCNGTRREDRERDNTTEEKEPQEGKERNKKEGEGEGKNRRREAPLEGNKKAAGRPAVGRTTPKADSVAEAKGHCLSPKRSDRPRTLKCRVWFFAGLNMRKTTCNSVNSPMKFLFFLEFGFLHYDLEKSSTNL